jgi:hypothetical protein
MPRERHRELPSKGIIEGIEKGGKNPPPTSARPSTPPGNTSPIHARRPGPQTEQTPNGSGRANED